MMALEYSEETTRLKIAKNWSVHRCRFCRFKTTSMFFMLNHAKRHQAELEGFDCKSAELEGYRCLDCEFSTDSTVFFKQHIQDSHVYKKDVRMNVTTCYACKICNYQTHFRLDWLKHTLKSHPSLVATFEGSKVLTPPKKRRKRRTGNKSRVCDECGFKTTKKAMLDRHIIIQHLPDDQIQWFHCDQCDYKAKLKYRIADHKKETHRGKPFKCDECSMRTTTKKALNRHKLRKHTKFDEIQWLCCHDCSYKSKTKTELIAHTRRHHSKDRKWFGCDHCDYKAKSGFELKSHKYHKHAKAAEINWFECDQCDFLSKTKGRVVRHKIEKHSEGDSGRWFECHHCGFRTRYKKSLEIHIQGQVSRRHECRKCGFETMSKCEFKEHLRKKHGKEVTRLKHH